MADRLVDMSDAILFHKLYPIVTKSAIKRDRFIGPALHRTEILPFDPSMSFPRDLKCHMKWCGMVTLGIFCGISPLLSQKDWNPNEVYEQLSDKIQKAVPELIIQVFPSKSP